MAQHKHHNNWHSHMQSHFHLAVLKNFHNSFQLAHAVLYSPQLILSQTQTQLITMHTNDNMTFQKKKQH
jgi:hypothetical protein